MTENGGWKREGACIAHSLISNYSVLYLINIKNNTKEKIIKENCAIQLDWNITRHTFCKRHNYVSTVYFFLHNHKISVSFLPCSLVTIYHIGTISAVYDDDTQYM